MLAKGVLVIKIFYYKYKIHIFDILISHVFSTKLFIYIKMLQIIIIIIKN